MNKINRELRERREREGREEKRKGERESRMDLMIIVLQTTLEVARSRTWRIGLRKIAHESK